MTNSAKEFFKFLVGHHVDNRVILLRYEPLTKHYLDPGILTKQFRRQLEDSSGLFEEFDAVLERLRNVHGLAVLPERRVGAFCHVVMKNDEVANVLDLGTHLRVEFIDIRLANARIREQLHQADDTALYQVDAR